MKPITHAHRRVCDVAVPNDGDTPATAHIRLEPIPGTIAGVHFTKGAPLPVDGYGLIVDDPCANPPIESLPRDVQVTLPPRHIAFVRVVVDTNDPPGGASAHAAFALTDMRHGKVVGGVTIVATTTAPVDTGVVTPAHPCPLTIAGGVYSVELGTNPAKIADAGLLRNDRPRTLVAPITNATSTRLSGAAVYLEHLDASGASFEPATWIIGTIEPGGRFWATWTVDARQAKPGAYEASIVVRDDNHEPIRLRAAFHVPSGRQG